MEQKYVVNGMLKVVDEVIEEKENRLQLDETSEMIENASSNKPQILIDQLFKHRAKLSMEEIRDEIITMIVAVSWNQNRSL